MESQENSSLETYVYFLDWINYRYFTTTNIWTISSQKDCFGHALMTTDKGVVSSLFFCDRMCICLAYVCCRKIVNIKSIKIADIYF